MPKVVLPQPSKGQLTLAVTPAPKRFPLRLPTNLTRVQRRILSAGEKLQAFVAERV
ncbi:MAG: hypothetical protein ACI9LY_003504, partial [Arenicella sp.]